jgi:FkbM family methyltransferase
VDPIHLAKELYWLGRKSPKDLPLALKSIVRSYGRPVVEVDGVKVRLDPGFSLEVLTSLAGGAYERPELRMVGARLEANDIVLEIGSGLGFISTYCAKIIGSERVHAFEGNPALESIIRETFKLNKVSPNFEICLIGAANGQVDFYVTKSFWASSTKMIPGGRKTVVPMKSFHQEVSRIKPTFLIIDIEGGETDLFSDAMDSLRSVRKIAIEIHPWVVGADAIDAMERKIIQAGFTRVEELSTPGRYLFLAR